MQLTKEEYAGKRIGNGRSVRIENPSLRITVRHHEACLVMPNSYPDDGIFNLHFTTIKDSYKNTPEIVAVVILKFVVCDFVMQ